MVRGMRKTILSLVALSTLAVGCGNSTTTADMTVVPPDMVPTGPGLDMTMINTTPDLAGTTSGMVTLTIDNYLSWCSVKVNNGTATTTETTTLMVPSGTTVNLSGDKANATFVWGYWFGTAGDTTAAHDKNMTTTVTVTKDTKVQACCPFASAPTTPCPAP